MAQDKKEKKSVLCLHGFGQNAEIFNKSLASLRSKNKQYNYIIPTAPHVIDEKEKKYAWWYYDEKDREKVNWDVLVNTYETTEPLLGLQKSLDMIKDILDKNQDIECILGFSQGAAFVGLMCYMGLLNKYKIAFIAGFPVLKFENPMPASIQSLHVFGLTDSVISPNHSEKLAALFTKPVMFAHKGKHVVPKIKI